MGYSCCICGLILADTNSDFPKWCKEIGAVCWFRDGPVLSDSGYVEDGAAAPFNLILPQHGYQQFYYRVPRDVTQDSCYPFHQACWSLLTEYYCGKQLDCFVLTLFDVFESIHYHKRALRWGHNYYLEDLIESCSITDSQIYPQEDIISANRAEIRILADPSLFSSLYDDNLRQKQFGPLPFRWSRSQTGNGAAVPSFEAMRLGLNHSPLSATISSPSLLYCLDDNISRLISLPFEILTLIMCNLDLHDLQKLFHASSMLYRQYGTDLGKLPSLFWQSRFWVYGETGFARSIRPPSYSWKDWYFTLKAEIRRGPNSMPLRNRRRIWKLVVDLANIVQAINDPSRALHGDATVPHTVVLGQATGAPQRELTQRYIRLTDMSQLHSIAPTYIKFSGKMLISGLTFLFCDGRSAHIGYVRTKQVSSDSCTIPPKLLWVVSSQLGFETLTVGAYPNEILGSIKPINAQRVAVTRWTAMRIVKICMDTNKQPGLESILWTPPYPLFLPVIHETDLAALQQLQGESYNPATGYLIESTYGRLTSVKLYSSLGFRAGITGIGFLYDSVSEHLWGTSDEAASFAFFLSRDEHIISVRIYTVESQVCHMQFTTNFHRISNVFPELPQIPNQVFECIEYRYLHGGHVKGVCGCFTGSSKRLHCFGVFPMKAAVSTKMSWTPPKITLPTQVDKTLLEMPLGGIRFHGSYRSRISLRQQYKSIQASISQTRSRYRRVGQVTGLLFYSSHDPDHPDLLGQWTGAGEVYNLHKDERIVDINVTKIQPIQRQRNRPGLSQVESIIIVTDRMRIKWSSSGCERDVLDHSHCQSDIKEVSWEFNAIFDRLSYV